MNITSFNFVQRFAALRQKLEVAKETFAQHQADAFVRTTPEGKSAVLDQVKTPEGSVTGVHRVGNNGAEDLEVRTSHVETRGLGVARTNADIQSGPNVPPASLAPWNLQAK